MKANKHRVWAEISLQAIEHNYRVICRQAKAPVLCVVKADAYGHGAARVAETLARAGAPYFAVATVPEAVELRENGIREPIMLLGYVDADDMEAAVRYHLTATVYDRQTAQLYSEAAVRAGEPLTVHYKLDTGMTRIGFPAWERDAAVREILDCAALPGLRSEGIFTHFAAADVPAGRAYTEAQYRRFCEVCDALAHAGLALPLRHCANSAGIERYGQMHGTMTRAGIILYGCRPEASEPCALDLRPAMTVKARVAQVRDIPAHTAISYGCTFETDKPTRVAVVTVGYADGYLRTGSGRAQILLGGQRAPVLGRICMDMCMVRVPTGVAVSRGDEATVFGASGWTAEDAAEAAGTIAYEMLCAVSRRVPRFFID